MRHTLLITFMFVVTIAFADKYKILYLSTETIEIGGKVLHEGDTFSDAAIIKWTRSSQSMRIKRVGGKGVKMKLVTRESMKDLKKQTVAALETQSNKTNSYSQQNIKNNHTSTRGAIKY